MSFPRLRLLVGTSAFGLIMAGAVPVHAQSAAGLRAAAGLKLPGINTPIAPRPPVGSDSLTPRQNSAMVRAMQNQARVASSLNLAAQAQAAAKAAAAAAAATKAGQAGFVPNGLVTGGLVMVKNPVLSANDPTGLNTWQGADKPIQVDANGKPITVDPNGKGEAAANVVVKQTESRAILSWETFNVGKDTTLTFDQKSGGVAQKDWVALNRVVGHLDPVTGLRSEGAKPSQILGKIKADGQVLVLNQAGVLFSGTAQVNTHSLVATSLEIGRARGLVGSTLTPLTIRQRNDEFLSFGLLGLADRAAASEQAQIFTFSAQAIDGVNDDPVAEGRIEVAAGAEITAEDSGYILLTGPQVVNSGKLSATNGQVSLQSGRRVRLTRSEGTATSANPLIRGLVVSSQNRQGDPTDYVWNTETAIIDSRRGYLSLGSTARGATLDDGLLLSSTSVSRNGFISLTGGTIKLGAGSTISITPDDTGETIPQSGSSVAAFKTSRIEIGDALSNIEIGRDSMILAPSADVLIGAAPGASALVADQADGTRPRVFIDSGAVIDVSGMKDVKIAAGRNTIKIDPLKGNELRDTPEYRDSFLNGATVYVDPRLSGVREDGVAWVGSPLIEAASYYDQVGVSAAELMTSGGNVSLGTASYGGVGDVTRAPDVIVKAGAVIDFSGGWTHYEGGNVITSRLITAGGAVVDIGAANPNTTYVGLVSGSTLDQPRYGITESFGNPVYAGTRYEPGYTEGRDAGSLTVKASAIAFDGTIHGDAYAGTQQRIDARVGTATSSIYGDRRRLQSVASQLPAAGYLNIQAVGLNTVSGLPTAGADIRVGATGALAALPGDLGFGESVTIGADGTLVVPLRDPLTLLPVERQNTIFLSADALNGAGLGQVSLLTSGSITVDAGSTVSVVPGGIVTAGAGRAITVNGTISAAGGSIDLATFNSNAGSIFAIDPPAVGSFDVIINGTLSTRGSWTNDFGVATADVGGSAFIDGGDIAITVAPRVSIAGETPQTGVDVSGSIRINDGALIDVSGGGYVDSTGAIDTSARGGDLSLVNQTSYFQISPINSEGISTPGNIPGFRVTGHPAIGLANNPAEITGTVSIASGTIRAHGFAGGGSFALEAPSIGFGSDGAGTLLPLDFFSKTGFADYSLTSYGTRLIANQFNNGLGGYNAVLATQVLTVGAGERLLLSQSRFSPILGAAQLAALQKMATGGSLYDVLTPGIPTNRYDRLGVGLTLGGLTELHVAEGGRIVGEAGASLKVAQLFNEGLIRLPGGTITQELRLFDLYDGALAVQDLSQAFSVNADGTIDEDAANAAGIAVNGVLLTNRELALQPIYLTADLGADEGIRLGAGSVTDLSGVSIRNPRQAQPANVATPLVSGTLLGGGTIETLAAFRDIATLYSAGTFDEGVYSSALISTAGSRVAATLNADAGAKIDLSGASDTYSQLTAGGTYVDRLQWSNGGRLALGNGGTIAGATIDAHGGAAAARGGTLEMLTPTLVATDLELPAANTISVAQIADAGFDDFTAFGSLNGLGDVTLNLRGNFALQSRAFNGATDSFDAYLPTVSATGNLAVEASHITFSSLLQSVASPLLGTPGLGTASFTADAIDVTGAVLFDQSLAAVSLNAKGDLRLIGALPYQQVLGLDTSTVSSSLRGQLLANGNLSITAAQLYPTTGSTFLVASAGVDSTITIARTAGTKAATPFSAGGNLTIQAAHIAQLGTVRTPIGSLTIGSGTATDYAPATLDVTLGAGSITSVSANGLSIPYGTTTDQIEWFFTPTNANALTAPPAAVLNIGGAAVTLDADATVDISGGGDLYAYEFVPGTGGSRDVLDRLNTDPYSSNGGFQYPDGRQVYAIVPGVSAADVAAYDPIYSAGYGDLYGSNIGKSVYLTGLSGVADGWYTLLPAKYAMLPGGMRIVEQTDASVVAGGKGTLKDGTQIATGYYGTAGTDIRESTLRTFSVQAQEIFRKYSNIVLSSANQVFGDRADRNDVAPPRLPRDAGRLVLEPGQLLDLAATLTTTAGTKGRGARVDISGDAFAIVSTMTPLATDPLTGVPVPGQPIQLAADGLTNLNADSLFIGGVRTDNADGTTTLAVTAHDITVANDGQHRLSAPEILLATTGDGATLTVLDGADIRATGTLADASTANYLTTGSGAVLRVSSGGERLLTRTEPGIVVTPAALTIGNATIRGGSALFESNGNAAISSAATITASNIALSAGAISFADSGLPRNGLVITRELQSRLDNATRLTLITNGALGFESGTYNFGNLVLDTGALSGLAAEDGTPATVAIGTKTLALGNSGATATACIEACAPGTLAITTDTLAFTGGTVRGAGFDGGTSITADGGVTYAGKGGFDAGGGALTVTTPYIIDTAVEITPDVTPVLPALTLASTGAVTISGQKTATALAGGTPGASLVITGDTITVSGTELRATAGLLSLRAANGIVVDNAATLSAPGYAKTFGDSADPYTVSAPGGTLSLVSTAGDIVLGKDTSLSVGGGAGKAGTLQLVAAAGIVQMDGSIDAAAPDGGGGLTLVTTGGFDLGSFARNQHGFTGAIDIRTATGDLALGAGRSLSAASLALTADGGLVTVAGTIDTSGISGGDVSLFGADGVALAATAVIDAHATGYPTSDSRVSAGGDVLLGTDGRGHVTVASGARIDVGADRTDTRVVPVVTNGETFYRLAEGDLGGTLTIRAPITTAAPGAPTVDVDFAGTVSGARSIVLEGFRHYDLGTIAADPTFTGVTITDGTAVLDTGAAVAGLTNFLSGSGAGTISDFIRGFDISAGYARLGGLDTVAGFQARPGVQLDYSGGIKLASNWNLAAAVVDVQGAVAAGDMVASTALPGKFVVVAGKEAHLLENFADFTYRVGGKVQGAVGALTLRAGGDLEIAGTITDGFFNFGDQTDAAYLNAVVGSSTKIQQPYINVTCVPFVCRSIGPYRPSGTSFQRINVDLAGIANFPLVDVSTPATPLPNDVPYSAAANSAAALGGDAPGGAALFPLLSDGSAVDSWSYRLVAGAAASADPMAINPASTAKLSVTGERSYSYGGSTNSYADSTNIAYGGNNGFTFDQLFDAIRATFPTTNPNAYTQITIPTTGDLGNFMRTELAAFIAANPTQARYVGLASNPTGVITTVTLADAFLTKIADAFNGYVQAALPPAGGTTGQTTARARNVVRTGTGSIQIAAAGDVDLTNGDITYANANGGASNAASGSQKGGSAIYTAGHVASLTAIDAIGPDGQTLRLNATPYTLGGTGEVEKTAFRYQGTLTGILVADPAYTEGGGDVTVTAGNDVLGRRDVSMEARLANGSAFTFIGMGDQPWRVGTIGDVTNLRINPVLFTSGIGALGGGSVTVDAGRDISDLTVTALTSATTADVSTTVVGATPFSQALWTVGGGNVALSAGRDILGGRIDVARGVATISAGRDITTAAALINVPQGQSTSNALRIRISDATAALSALGDLRIAGIAALGVQQVASAQQANLDSRGFYTANAGVSLLANGGVTVDNLGADVTVDAGRSGVPRTAVYPGSFEAFALTGGINLAPALTSSQTAAVIDLLPSAKGQLNIVAGGTIAPVTIAMDDRDPGQLPGLFSDFQVDSGGTLVAGQDFGFPAVLPSTTPTERAALHNAALTHLGDDQPIRLIAGGDIGNVILSAPKQARISAGRDIVNMMFFGQNLTTTDITRVTAGRDIIATTSLVRADLTDGNSGAPLSALQGNTFVIGGPGTFMLEAGRDAGPFLNSATTNPRRLENGSIGFGGLLDFGGGILSVGNEWNPYLPTTGADLIVQFGVAKGADYTTLRETYLNPANLDALDDDLFVQVEDANGNKIADRTQPIYGRLLIAWMQANAADKLTSAFGTTDVSFEQAYQAFAALPQLRQRPFLINGLYFNELEQTSIPDGASYLQYSRGYRAVNTLFPASLGYTANSLDGGTAGAENTVETGNLDLRLATIQTSRGGNIALLGPGGRILAGSTVRTSDQAARRSYDGARLFAGDRPTVFLGNGNPATGFSQIAPASIDAIPTGYEGILTLRGGAIRSFTDRDVLLNQSRLFTQAGGDITLWSSNGDLNAGQGPKTSANFPPVAIRIDENAFSEVDAVGGVSGAGIAAFQPDPNATAPDVFLIAPRGTVDAGDAGVRVAGNLFIAAAAVANADNFQVGGTSFGIPTSPVVDSGAAAAANAASAAASQLAESAAGGRRADDLLSRITVDVLGFGGNGTDDPCNGPAPRPADCPAP